MPYTSFGLPAMTDRTIHTRSSKPPKPAAIQIHIFRFIYSLFADVRIIPAPVNISAAITTELLLNRQFPDQRFAFLLVPRQRSLDHCDRGIRRTDILHFHFLAFQLFV